MIRKHGRKKRKCWLPAFSPFSTFSKYFSFRVVKSQDCLLKSYTHEKVLHNNVHAEPFFGWHIFSPAQIEWICGHKIYLYSNHEMLLSQGRKHCGKRRKCWLPAFSPFPTLFSTDIFPLGHQKLALCNIRVTPYFQPKSKGILTHYHTIPHFDTLKIYIAVENIEKRRNCL